MRSLDEVIEGYERCHGAYGTDESCEYCPLFDICEHDPQMASPWDDDMYHYLKEFQGLSKMWNDKLDKEQKNDLLTWDELKQMELKPVWVEWTKTEESYWCFVGEWFDDDEMRIYHIGRDYADYIHKTVYTPDIVQAYRKER